MATRLATATRNGIVDSIAAKVDAGSGAGTIEIRTGTQPASANNSATGTLLSTIICSDPSFGSSSAGSNALSGVPLTDAADNSGTAGWFRIKDSNGATVLDGMCSMSGGGGEMILDNTSLATGQNFIITALTLTAPSGE